MSESDSFAHLIRRVRAGDEAAAVELVRSYEPAIRDAARRRLSSARLQSLLDSMDIAQSVLNSFFVRAAAGQYELHKPEDLLKLLVRMARNKAIDQARKNKAAAAVAGLGGKDLAAADPTPGRQAAARELFVEIQRRLRPAERQLAELRYQGLDWHAIAAQLGGTAQARRKQLTRALDRVTRQLGLDQER
jgi:RNA polymerase sigma factor (sigma-70 family)